LVTGSDVLDYLVEHAWRDVVFMRLTSLMNAMLPLMAVLALIAEVIIGV